MMTKIQHYINLNELANEYQYSILAKSEFCFLGLDLIEKKYCIVHFKQKDLQYILDIDIEPVCYQTEDEAIQVFNNMVRESLKKEI